MMKKILLGALLFTLLIPAVAMDKPCAAWRWDDDPEYKISGHVVGFEHKQAWNTIDKTYIHFADNREACFTELLDPDQVRSGEDVTFVYKRHCDMSCYTYVRTEKGK